MTWKKIFAVVTISALIGMVMGGLFGLVAGRLALGHSNGTR
jgi:L-cystine uptake protein TcyP (sodium:dicarboxylate symporter family)